MNVTVKPPNKRRTYFIEKSFQARFILKFSSLVLLSGLLTTLILYFLSMRSTTVSIVDSRVVVRTTADFLLPILIQTILVVMVFVSIGAILVTLFVSHKIAGPLYHFKKKMEDLGQGDFSDSFGLRHGDQLHDLAVSVNNMVTKIRQEIKGLKGLLYSLKEKSGRLQGEEELKKLCRELNKKIDYFKTE